MAKRDQLKELQRAGRRPGMRRVREQDVVAALGNLREKLGGNVGVAAHVLETLMSDVMIEARHVEGRRSTEKVRRQVIPWFKRQGFLDADAAAAMLAWEHGGFSVDASIRITLIDRDVSSYFNSLERFLRYYVSPPFALERLPVIRDRYGRITRVRYVLPRHQAAMRQDSETGYADATKSPPQRV